MQAFDDFRAQEVFELFAQMAKSGQVLSPHPQ